MSKIVSLRDASGSRKNYDVSEIKARHLNQWQGWECSVGTNTIHIDFDGGVWAGTCRVGGKLGNIFDGWKDVPGWLSCTKKQCNCGTEIKIPKYKPGHESSLDGNYSEQGEFDEGSVVSADFNQPMIPHVQWDLGRFCNYDCSYCLKGPNGIHNDTEPHKPIDVLLRTVDKLHVWATGKTLRFCFSGGEPTLHPQFIELCQYIKSLGHRVHLTSNGSHGPKMWRRIAEVIDDVSISVHFEFNRDAVLVKNIQALLQHKLGLSGRFGMEIKLMTQPHDFDRAMALRDELSKLHPDFFRHVVTHIAPLRVMLGQHELMDYNPEQISQFGMIKPPGR